MSANASGGRSPGESVARTTVTGAQSRDLTLKRSESRTARSPRRACSTAARKAGRSEGWITPRTGWPAHCSGVSPSSGVTSWLMRSTRQKSSTVPRTTLPGSGTLDTGGSTRNWLSYSAKGTTAASPTRTPSTSTTLTQTENTSIGVLRMSEPADGLVAGQFAVGQRLKAEPGDVPIVGGQPVQAGRAGEQRRRWSRARRPAPGSRPAAARTAGPPPRAERRTTPQAP